MTAKAADNTPQEFAKAASTWDSPSWWALEARAYRQYPQLSIALARLAPAKSRREFLRVRPSPLSTLLAVAEIAAVVLPVVAAVRVGQNFVDDFAPVDVGFAGILAAVAVTLGVVGIAVSSARPENIDTRTARLIGTVHLGASSVSAALSVAAIREGRAEGPWGLIGIALDLALGIFLVLRSREAKDERAEVLRNAGVNLRRRLDELTPVQQVAIITALHASVDSLAVRGLITADDAAKARRAPIGLLAMTMTIPGVPPVAPQS